VLDYLGRYTHRVAISNHRLVDFDGEQVSFRWRDSAHQNKQRILSLNGEEFLRRFLLHILPTGFQRIRHYGLFANRDRQANLERCRHAIGQSEPIMPLPETPETFIQRVAGIDIHQCPYCHQGRLQHQASLPPQRFDLLPTRPP
jgi:hypothetical protein